MIRIMIAAALGFAAVPAAAQQRDWRHAESGVSLPREIGDLRVGQEQEFGGAGRYDVVLQLGEGQEPATLYVYRSAYPNPALWFDRVRTAMNTTVGATGVQAQPRTFTLGGAASPNGLREEFDLPQGGQWRSTAVAIIQAGEWIVKARVTSATMDRSGVAARMDRLLAALRFANPIPAPNPLRVPAACADDPEMTGAPLQNGREEARAAASVIGVAVFAEARGHGGLATDPGAWCRAQTDIPAQYGTAYRRLTGGEWVVLISDSGRTVSARSLDPALPRAVATFVNLPMSTRVVNLFDGLPPIGRSFIEAVPVISGQSRGIAEISVGRDPPRQP